MLKMGRASLTAAAGLALVFSGAAEAKKSEWQQISLGAGGTSASEIEIEMLQPDGTSSARTLRPSCSGGPISLGPQGPIVAAPTDYSFFIQKGNPNRILIALDGGGGCWDAGTCVGSPIVGRSTYVPLVDETTESLAQSQGILDDKNGANPFHNYTKVFIPYCTGDIHWGSRDTNYTLETEFGPLSWKVYHRGTDNFLAALDWLENNGVKLNKAKDVTVAGVSAGAYGANLAFAYVAQKTSSKARLNLISDSGVGVIDDPTPFDNLGNPSPLPFFSEAIYNPAGGESWGVAQNLPFWVFGPYPEAFLAASANSPLQLLPSFFIALGQYKPDAKLAAITTNSDITQVFFYGLMKGVVPPTGQEFGEWYGAMSFMTSAPSVAGLPNYRYFIENGQCHTFLFFDDEFYRDGANGTSVADWVTAMVKPGNRAWDYLDAGIPDGTSQPCTFENR
jgi:hypothetical protein